MSQHPLSGVLVVIRDELFGLFVDDGVFAGAILVWVVVGWRILPRLGLPGCLAAVLLFAGLAIILAFGALRSARKRGF